MSSQKTSAPSIKKVFNTTVKSLKNSPVLFVPFLSFLIIELIALIIIFLAPRMPLRLLLGPVIKTFWGERFLHYPLNFLLLPKLASLSKMVIAVIFSSLLTGMAVAIVSDIYHKKQLKLGTSFKSACKKYINLFAVVLTFTLLFYFSMKLVSVGVMRYFLAGNSRLLFLGIGAWMGPGLMAINLVFAILIQSAFAYAIPLLIIDNEKLIRAMLRSVLLFKKLFFQTIALVGLPMLIAVPFIILQYKSAFLIDRLFPESVLLLLFATSIVSSLIIDSLITVSTTVLYLMNKENQ